MNDPMAVRTTDDRTAPELRAPERRVPDYRVPDILARAVELDRERLETSSVEALRAVAVDAGISLSSLEAALEEYAAKSGRPAPGSTPQGKSARTGTLLAVFLGGFGAHRFYLGDRKGLFYLPFFWTLVPSVVGLVEAFLMPDRVRAHNRRAELVEAVRAHKLLTAAQAPIPYRERRPCPMCAELILPEARICRYCGSNLG